MTEVPDDIPEEATFVFLYENPLEDIAAGAFQDLPKLEVLGIYENKLKSLRGDMWQGMTKIKVLNFEENEITSLSRDSFSVQSSAGDYSSALTDTCTWLYLEKNEIASIADNSFADLTSLERLFLSKNDLTEVRPAMWRGLVNLVELNIDDSQITDIPTAAFAEMPKLNKLDLSGNLLTEVTGDMFSGIDLWSLNIGSNLITSIRDLPRASYVYFTKNLLTTLEEDTFLPDAEGEPKINLHLPKNPFHCDKRMCWLKEAEKNKRVFFYYWSYSTSSPSCENFPGVDWREVDLGCGEEE